MKVHCSSSPVPVYSSATKASIRETIPACQVRGQLEICRMARPRGHGNSTLAAKHLLRPGDRPDHTVRGRNRVRFFVKEPRASSVCRATADPGNHRIAALLRRAARQCERAAACSIRHAQLMLKRHRTGNVAVIHPVVMQPYATVTAARARGNRANVGDDVGARTAAGATRWRRVADRCKIDRK